MTLHASPFQLFYIFFEYLFAHVARLLFPLEPRAEYNVEGKTAVITGANSGLGKQTADVLAQRGAKVILACRDLDSANTVVHKIRESTGNNNVECLQLDLADMGSIHSFAKEVTKLHPTIDILVNNAGISLNDPERKFTKDRFEMHMGTNHLGHFLLTKLLLGNIQKSDIARVVTVSSTACVMSNLDLDDLMMNSAQNLGIGNTMPYNNSKFANALFTKELAKRYENITAFSVCPGLAQTQIFRNYSSGVQKIINAILALGIPVEKGADTILQCCMGQLVAQDSGRFYRFGKLVPSIEQLLSDEMAATLWERSDALVTK